jgi:hypothetical protein
MSTHFKSSGSKRLLSGLQNRLAIKERLFELPEHSNSLNDDLLVGDALPPMKMATAQVVGMHSEGYNTDGPMLGAVHQEIDDGSGVNDGSVDPVIRVCEFAALQSASYAHRV